MLIHFRVPFSILSYEFKGREENKVVHRDKQKSAKNIYRMAMGITTNHWGKDQNIPAS